MSGDDHFDPTVMSPTDNESYSEDFGNKDAFDGSNTLDYLGLADPNIRSSYMDSGLSADATSASNLRNRASTLASSMARPRMLPVDGRARSSSILPAITFDNVLDRDDGGVPLRPVDHVGSSLSGSQTPLSTGHGNSLVSTALHNRLSQYVTRPGEADPHRPDVNHTSSRPRATSMGVLDAPAGPISTSSGPIEIDADAIRSYALENNIDPNDFLSFAQNNTSAGSLGIGGRNRAGTVVALSGPGGRQRTEQELMRMAQAAAARSNHLRSNLSSSYATDSTSPDRTGNRHAIPSATPTTPGTPGGSIAQAPTRSLWIGQLDPSMTGQDLMQAFGPYGAIESLRLLHDKSCGFVNFVEMQDAIKAKEDVMGRLGGRIGLKTTSNDGTIRIGFGKIDSAPLAPGSGLAPRGPSTPRIDSPGIEGLPGTPGEPNNGSPTRALWIGSIPANTTISALLSIFSPFGPIESARVLSHKNCGFINFERVDDAVRARKALNGRELLGAEVGGVKVGFAKAPTKSQDNAFHAELATPEFAAAVDALADLKGASAISADNQLLGGSLESYRSNMVLDLLEKQRLQHATGTAPSTTASLLGGDARGPPSSAAFVPRGPGYHTHSSSNSIVPSSDKGGVPLPIEMRPQATVSDLQLLMRQLDEDDPNLEEDLEVVARFRPLTEYHTKVPLVSEVSASRRFDTAKLRELRKSIETGTCSQVDCDNLAKEFLPNIVELSSDYIGNTVVQKLFERCTEGVKMLMLEMIAPHLAMIGIHKNGTWSAQKIIECTRTEEQRSLIARHVLPYVPPLLLDQFANYVVQRLLPFGAPQNDFIFDAMVDRCWEVAQGRFGARSMRACLESKLVTRLQQKRVALAIILNSVPLATSQNGALLVTWLLDTSNLPGRFRLLVPRFTPHLTHLCTHKLASLTVLRIIGQRQDPEASQEILRALLDPAKPHILEEVLTDQIHGSQFVSKLLTTSPLDPHDRAHCVERVSRLMVEHSLIGVPAYKQLVETLGLRHDPAVDLNLKMAQMAMNQRFPRPPQAQAVRQAHSDPFNPWSPPPPTADEFLVDRPSPYAYPR